MAVKRSQVIDGAVRGVLAAHLADFRKGSIDIEDVIEQARRRLDAIRQEFTATVMRLRARVARCAGQSLEAGGQLARCAAPANTTIGGKSYCTSCARAARLADPREAA